MHTLEYLCKAVSTYITIPLVIFSGFFLFITLNWASFYKLLIRLFRSQGRAKLGKRNFIETTMALMAVIGGNLGTGNISGIAIAIIMGGPGALFWMWIMASLGSIIKFSGIYLATSSNNFNEKNHKIGPFEYLSYADPNIFRFLITKARPFFKLPKITNKAHSFSLLPKLYAILIICCSLTVGNFVQINSLTIPLVEIGFSKMIISIFVTLLVGCIVFKGKKIFSRITVVLVPIMSLIYISASIYIICINHSKIIPSINLIFNNAFNYHSVKGGILSYAFINTVRIGFDRGLFATDAGVGLAPILHSEVSIKKHISIRAHAFEQAFVGMMAPFIVVIICTITGFVLLTTDVWQLTDKKSSSLCIEAFIRSFNNDKAGLIVYLTLFLFALTTLLTWAHCGIKSLLFLNPKLVLLYKIIFVLVICIGVYFRVEILWNLADLFLNLALLINIYGILFSSKKILQ